MPAEQYTSALRADGIRLKSIPIILPPKISTRSRINPSGARQAPAESRNKMTVLLRAPVYSMPSYSRLWNSLRPMTSRVSKLAPQKRHFNAAALIDLPQFGHGFSPPHALD